MAYINGKEIIFSPIINISEGVKKYSASVTYKAGDIVSYDGSLYSAKFDNTSNVLPTDTSRWENLNETITNLNEIRKAISGRGGEIDISAGLADCPDAIFNIPADTSLAFQEDSTSAYRKLVPVKAEEYALIKKIGGMSYKCNNLFDVNGETKKAESGIYVSDGKIKADSCSGWGGEHIVYSNIYPAGTYTMSLKSNDTSDTDYTSYGQKRILFSVQLSNIKGFSDGMFNSYYGLYLYISQSWNDSVTFTATEPFQLGFAIAAQQERSVEYYDIMLNYGETALPYEPFFKGLRDTKVTSIESRGANLIPFPYVEGGVNTTMTSNGITFTVNDNRSITINGTSTGVGYFRVASSLNLPPNTTFVLSGSNALSSSMMLYITLSKNGGWYKEYYNVGGTPCVFTTEEGCVYNIQIYVYSGNTFDNETIYPMLNYGTEAAPYKPYKADALDTFPIPTSITNREDWGRGVSEAYHNGIEYRDGRWFYVKRTKRLICNGTEGWMLGGTSDYPTSCRVELYYTDVLNASTSDIAIKSNLYPSRTSGDTYRKIIGISTSSQYIQIYDTEYNTDNIGLWKSHLAELYASGNPLVIEYALAEPIEEDITDLIDSGFIKVEGGGSIVANNTYEQDAPSTIKYTVKVGS